MLKKIFIVIDVNDEQQRDRIQIIANDISNMRVLDGNRIENIYPMFKKYESDIRQIFHTVSTNGFGASTMMAIGKLASRMLKK